MLGHAVDPDPTDGAERMAAGTAVEGREWVAGFKTRVAMVRSAIAEAWARFVRWFNRRGLSENAILLGFAVAIGVLTALGVVLFYRAIDLAFAAFFRWSAVALPQTARLAYRPVVTGASIALAWLVMRRLAGGHDGMNVPDVQLAVVRRGGDVPVRPALARTLASAITIGGGGSAGSEGPVVVLGAAIGSWLGRTFRFTPERVSVFVGCASGAAISAAFNAPLAGAFFALEEILGSLSVASFSPVVVASVIAAVVSRAFFGNHPAFPIPQQYGFGSVGEVLVLYPGLGILTGLVSVMYVRIISRQIKRTNGHASDSPAPGSLGCLVRWLACWYGCLAACWSGTGTWRCMPRCSAGSPGMRCSRWRSARSSRLRSHSRAAGRVACSHRRCTLEPQRVADSVRSSRTRLQRSESVHPPTHSLGWAV